MIYSGMNVTIAAPGLKLCRGKIERVIEIANLPRVAALDRQAESIGYRDSAEAARSMLAQSGVSRMATISYFPESGERKTFTAFEIDGWWQDQTGAPLMIEQAEVN